MIVQRLCLVKNDTKTAFFSFLANDLIKATSPNKSFGFSLFL